MSTEILCGTFFLIQKYQFPESIYTTRPHVSVFKSFRFHFNLKHIKVSTTRQKFSRIVLVRPYDTTLITKITMIFSPNGMVFMIEKWTNTVIMNICFGSSTRQLVVLISLRLSEISAFNSVFESLRFQCKRAYVWTGGQNA